MAVINPFRRPEPESAGPNAMTLDLSRLSVSALADELRDWEDGGVRPWRGEIGESERKKVAAHFKWANGLVRAGHLTDWPKP